MTMKKEVGNWPQFNPLLFHEGRKERRLLLTGVAEIVGVFREISSGKKTTI